jgi:disulfide bond formation protein DsbB
MIEQGQTRTTASRLLQAALMPRSAAALVLVACLGLLAFGLYLQHGLGLEPCPMCIVQRYALVLIAVCSALAGLVAQRVVQQLGLAAACVLAGFGAFVAARQSWLQWFPPESYSCGRDFYGMIETFPLKRAIPMIFRGSGDCTKVDWTLLGLSIANWSALAFLALLAFALAVLWRQWRIGQEPRRLAAVRA